MNTVLRFKSFSNYLEQQLTISLYQYFLVDTEGFDFRYPFGFTTHNGGSNIIEPVIYV